VDLLLEPADTSECRAMIAAMEASLGGVEMRVTTWLPAAGRLLRRAIIGVDGSVVFRSEGLDAGDLDSMTARFIAPVECDSEIYVETLSAPQRLFVLGAGEDAKPVVTMASLLGWKVTVADGRARLARAERFAEAERVLAIASLAELGIGVADAVVVMTHSYEQDRVFLVGALVSNAGYIGLLGAAHRSSLLIGEAAAILGRSVAECCERMWAPVGMDLGGDGAEAIALAVVAEVQAWRQGKLGASRRLSAVDVARQIAQGGASRTLQTQCAMGSAER
jgi:xanthine/CO dehydrogenase XdhC/CoxF family maturation factor